MYNEDQRVNIMGKHILNLIVCCNVFLNEIRYQTKYLLKWHPQR